nr:BV-like protein [Cotesia vestalis bracovirus]
MSCHCLKKLKVTHKQVCMVPRQWLKNTRLECILYNKIKFHYCLHGKFEDLVIKLVGVKASFERYSNQLWARKDFDWATKPDKKSYLAVFFPCIFCSEPLF